MIWDHKYELGIREIDEQHTQWLALTTQLLDALLIGTIKQEIRAIFREAYAYTAHHLKYEEEMMAESGYPDLEHHKALHQELITQLKKIEAQIEQSHYAESDQLVSEEMQALVKVFQNWLITHIEIEDKKYVPYIK